MSQKTVVKTVKRTVFSLANGEEKTAHFMICPDCGCDAFLIFTIKGHDHSHVECALCGTSYCPVSGKCHEEAARMKERRRV
jgi:nitrite reductase/ring-hydroxylating ferredoxin subunit